MSRAAGSAGDVGAGRFDQALASPPSSSGLDADGSRRGCVRDRAIMIVGFGRDGRAAGAAEPSAALHPRLHHDVRRDATSTCNCAGRRAAQPTGTHRHLVGRLPANTSLCQSVHAQGPIQAAQASHRPVCPPGV
ncbi:hypothetical protein S7711_11119 [Stachybotrys chartarum IBT 7711]|uniref:Uncharacterized protein n=1 Tax=Stachybotrys chartarum (strain CBS 109288 / IBT 7711) TaxID=1280523 RepID=A0A084BCC9_STACB|nr:hypothetical protein S7711_11119 [Stachybotrys chartarum IBT 7711]KFA70840.1 hypothetical protein S40288_11606 [Stachybotrys chartarum IBT 40288]